MLHPVGPRSSRTYWVRRVSVIVLAVLALVAVVFLVVQRAGASPSRQAAVTGTTSSQPSLTGVLASAVLPTGAVPGGPSPVSGQSRGAGPSPSGESSSSIAATSAGTSATLAMTGSLVPSAARPTTAAGTTAAGTTAAGTIEPATTAATGFPPKKPAPSTTKPMASTTKPAATAATKPAATHPAAPPATASPRAQPPAPRPARPVAPTTDAQGRLLCSDAVMRLQATTGAPGYRSGQQPVLGLTVSSTGTAACVRDLSGALQVFSVYTAGGTRVWSTVDCSPGTGTDVRQLQPGQLLQYNIRWSGTTSQPACAGDRLTVPPGQYQLRVTVGTLNATPVAFSLT